jgi:SAM-dependent methyltransferase
MNEPAEAPTRVREHFHENARSFDDLYEDQRLLQRLLRPGLFRRRELALQAVRSDPDARVLDVGCGSGRVGELALLEGARSWLGVDFAPDMLALARQRLARFGGRVRIVQGDFLEVPLEGPFEVVLALGLFDYVGEPEPFLARMAELCARGGSLVASFPSWSPLKGPVRRLRYERLNDCPIFDYDEPGVRALLQNTGFERAEIRARRSGMLARAWR